MFQAFLRDRAIPGILHHSQISWTLVDQAVVSAANFLTSLIVARNLGIEAFGVFSVAWLILLFVQSLQIALILTPMLSIGPKTDADQQTDYYTSLLPLQMVFALLSAAVAALFSAYGGHFAGMGNTGTALALPLALTVAASQLHEFARRVCYARVRPQAALAMDLARYGTQFALFLYLFINGHGTVANTLYAVAACALMGLVATARQLPFPSWRSERVRATAGRHWNMSKWLVPSALMQWTSGNFFTLAAGTLLGPVAVGAMRAAQNLMGVTHVFFQALDNWAPVRASHIQARQGVTGLRTFTRKLLLVTGGGTAIAALTLAVPAGFWLELLYGGEYASHGWLVANYGAAYVLMALSAPYRYAFMALENTRPMFFGYFAATIFSISGVYPLIGFFGMTGAMIGVVATQLFLLSSLWWSMRNLKTGVL